MSRSSNWRAVLAVVALAGAAVRAAPPVTEGFHAPAGMPASAAPRHRPAPRAAVPAANFLVEWRVQPVDAVSARGDVVIGSRSAATGGASGFGPGAVVVGTARATPPQSVRVANGREGAIVFDRAETHRVWDMSYAADARASARTDPSTPLLPGAASPAGGESRARAQSRERGVAGHEVVVHRVDGLRVTPHWSRGDTLLLDVQLTHAGPTSLARTSDADARASRDVDFHSTVQASFDEWLSVATVGEGGEELQIRVSWR